MEFALESADKSWRVVRGTNEDGMIVFTNVPFGSYTLYETRPAEGYYLDPEKTQVEITEENRVVSVIRYNDVVELLPETGGRGTGVVTLYAGLFVLLALGFVWSAERFSGWKTKNHTAC